MTLRGDQHTCEALTRRGVGRRTTPGGAAGRTRILLAEKLPLARDVIEAVLEAFGLSADIIVAETFTDALDRASDVTNLDLALVSRILPGMKDLGALAVIKSALPKARVAVLSDSCRRADVLAAFEHGAHAYLHARMTKKALVHALRLTLEGEKFVPWAAFSDARRDTPAQRASEMHGSPRPLSPRERQVLMLLKEGMSNRDIATNLGLKGSTVNTYLGALYNKLGVANRGQLIACDGDDPACFATPAGGGSGEVGAPTLSTRDQAVLAMLEKRLSNREIAQRLGMPLATLKYNLGRLYAKLGAASRAQAVHIAARLHGPDKRQPNGRKRTCPITAPRPAATPAPDGASLRSRVGLRRVCEATPSAWRV